MAQNQPELSPAVVRAYHEANSLRSEGRLYEAESRLQFIIDAAPPLKDVHHLLGLVKLELKELPASIEHLKKGAELAPDDLAVHHHLFYVCSLSMQFADAEAAIRRCLQIEPTNPDLWVDLSGVLRKLGDDQGGRDAVKNALDLDKSSARAWSELGYFQHRLDLDTDAAEESYRKAISFNPGLIDPHVNLALIEKTRGNWTQCRSGFSQVVKQFPENTIVKFYLGTEQLRCGDFQAGFQNYQYRFDRHGITRVDQVFDAPYWAGEPVDDKVLLIWTEQGVGDEILCLSIAADLVDRAKKTVLVSTDGMVDLVRRSFPCAEHYTYSQILSEGQRPYADVQASFSHIGFYLLQSFDDFPTRQQLLTLDQERTKAFRTKYQKGREVPLVGFAWKSPKSLEPAEKSAPLEAWAPILETEGIQFVCLQYLVTDEERAWLSDRFGDKVVFEDTLELGKDMDGWASQAGAMDLVISTSTTTVHLAGAAGIPCWVLLPFSDGLRWCWFLDRNDSPWYPSVTLDRQTSFRAWDEQIARIADRLKAWAVPGNGK